MKKGLSPHHSIKTAARLTGLSEHLIRVWEKRYRAVAPKRTGTNRRVYSDAEIERLNLLRLATNAGHSIGNVARLPVARLRSLVARAHPDGAVHARKDRLSPAQDFHDDSLAAIRKFDAQEFEAVLQKAVVTLGHQGLLRQVVSPLAHTVGELWRSGEITAAHEHFLTAGLKVFLGNLSSQFSAGANAPRIVIATPSGQLHELGAVIARDAAAQIGWQTIYMGASLPAAEIAGAVMQNRALAVALSIVYPGDDADLPRELTSLRRFLPAGTKIFAGGRAAEDYRETLSRIGATVTNDLDEFCRELDQMRRAAKPDRK